MVSRRAKLAVIALALLLGAIAQPAPVRAEPKPSTIVEASRLDVFAAGERFVLVIRQPDGGALLNLVEGPELKRPDGVTPRAADVIRRARIIFTFRMSPDGQVTASKVTNLRIVTSTQALSSTPPADVNARIAAAVSELANIGRMLHSATKNATPSSATAPSSDTAK